jgi:predicted HTH domain antitoxin
MEQRKLAVYRGGTQMSITLQVPDSVARSLRLPEGEAEDRLRLELAISLYSQDILSFGKACELSRLSRWNFADLLTGRGIPRHYGERELAEDLEYGRG